jgi:hypothetical protein
VLPILAGDARQDACTNGFHAQTISHRNHQLISYLLCAWAAHRRSLAHDRRPVVTAVFRPEDGTWNSGQAG